MHARPSRCSRSQARAHSTSKECERKFNSGRTSAKSSRIVYSSIPVRHSTLHSSRRMHSTSISANAGGRGIGNAGGVALAKRVRELTVRRSLADIPDR